MDPEQKNHEIESFGNASTGVDYNDTPAEAETHGFASRVGDIVDHPAF